MRQTAKSLHVVSHSANAFSSPEISCAARAIITTININAQTAQNHKPCLRDLVLFYGGIKKQGKCISTTT